MGTDKDSILAKLAAGIITVTFTKRDGSERVMRCTKSSGFIPAEHTPKGTDRPDNPDVAKVFDLDAQGWRSFRFDSVKSVTGVQ